MADEEIRAAAEQAAKTIVDRFYVGEADNPALIEQYTYPEKMEQHRQLLHAMIVDAILNASKRTTRSS